MGRGEGVQLRLRRFVRPAGDACKQYRTMGRRGRRCVVMALALALGVNAAWGWTQRAVYKDEDGRVYAYQSCWYTMVDLPGVVAKGIEVHVFTLQGMRLNAKGEIEDAAIGRELAVGDEFDPDSGVYARVDLLAGCAVDYAIERLGVIDQLGLKEVRSVMHRLEQEEKLSRYRRKEEVKAYREYFYVMGRVTGFHDNGIFASPVSPFYHYVDFMEQSDATITLAPLEKQYRDAGYYWSLRPAGGAGWVLRDGVPIRPLKQGAFIAEVRNASGLDEYVVSYSVAGEVARATEIMGSAVRLVPGGSVTVSATFRKADGKVRVTVPPRDLEPRERGGYTVANADGRELKPGEHSMDYGTELKYRIRGASFPYENRPADGEGWSGKVVAETDFRMEAPMLYQKCTVRFYQDSFSEGIYYERGYRYNANFNVTPSNPYDPKRPKVIAEGAMPVRVDEYGYGVYVVRDSVVDIYMRSDRWGKLRVVTSRGGRVRVVRNGREITERDAIRRKDRLVVLGEPDAAEGYKLKEIVVNGVPFESGETYTVEKGDVKVVADFVKADANAVESELLAGVAATPNPCGVRLTLRGASDAARWEVYTVQGQLVACGVSAGEGAIEISTAGWAPGLYCVRLEAADGVRVLTVVKE